MTRRLKPAIAYTRVSTQKQDETGVGHELQMARIKEFARQAGYELVDTFSDAQTGMGEDSIKNREGIRNAIILSRKLGAPILVDGWSRVSRNVQALEDAVREGRLTVISCSPSENGSHAAAMGEVARAQREGEVISERTRAALQKLKREGVKLGNPKNLDEAQKKGAAANRERARERVDELAPIIRELRAEGRTTAKAIAEGLNLRNVSTARGGAWNAASVRRFMERVDELDRQQQRAQDLENPSWGMF